MSHFISLSRISLVIGLVSVGIHAHAAVLSGVTYQPFTEFAVDQIAPIATGAELDGARIEVERASTTLEVSTMSATSPATSSTTGLGWEFVVSGETGTTATEWILAPIGSGLTTDPIVRMSIILADPTSPPAFHSVFDVTDPSPGTVGSDTGITFDLGPSAVGTWSVAAQYSDPVSLGGAPTEGDAFGRLDLFFGLGENDSAFGLAQEDLLAFHADTDLVGVPEPTSVLLLLCSAALSMTLRRSI